MIAIHECNFVPRGAKRIPVCFCGAIGPSGKATTPLRFGFRRRCGWCGVVLRGWQLNLCRRCKERTQDAGLYLQSGGPWCRQTSRWEDEPDSFRRTPITPIPSGETHDA